MTKDGCMAFMTNQEFAEHMFKQEKRNAYTDALIKEVRQLRDENADLIEPLQAQTKVTGETSDGYHTFNELYHHRAVLFSVICNDRPDVSWKSKLHHDGTMFDGMFIVGIQTPEGQATYHYDIDPYWDMFRVLELTQAPEWDGHTPEQAIERIGNLPSMYTSLSASQRGEKAVVDEAPTIDPVKNGEWVLVGTNEHDYETSVEEKCSLCGRYVYRYDTQPQDNYCPDAVGIG